ncbi:MAG: DNA translocase FtsK [Candidatus Aureabacteria bacterium]|nr:DNA translocase FtsK [Candidatus Auribacterota bacterium]
MKERKFLKEILGLLFGFLAILIFLALISYTPDDLASNKFPHNQPAVNKIGVVGAWVSFKFLFYFGFSAYFVPIILCFFSLFFIKGISGKKFIAKIFLALGLITFISILFSVLDLTFLESFRSKINIPDQGGAIGPFLGGRAYSIYIGITGALLVLSAVILIFFLLFTELSFYKTTKFISSEIKNLVVFCSSVFTSLYKKTKQFINFLTVKMVKMREGSKEKRTVKKYFDDEEEIEEDEEIDEIEEDDDEINEDEEDDDEIEEEKNQKVKKKGSLLSRIKRKPKPKSKPKVVKKRVFDPSLPTLDILKDYESGGDDEDEGKRLIEKSSEILEKTLSDFGLDIKVLNVLKGPAVTRYEIGIAPGTKVEKIVSLSNNIALAMKAISVRIIAPIPGKSAVGIEIPNVKKALVSLKEMLESRENVEANCTIPLALGKDISGTPVIVDLVDMPHLLIAGATGSGKSVCINSLISTLLFSSTPDQIRFVLVDPKKVELSCYKGIPHLYCPIINNAQKASLVLRLLLKEMENRYETFAHMGVRNISAYHKQRDKLIEEMKEKEGKEELDDVPENLPNIVIIIDELADLILVSSSDVQDSIIRLAQLSRAVGMHLILATQRPSVKVVTGLIKANIPSRISFQLPSKVDSRTVLDANGADKLLGDGDMLFLPPATSRLIRAQGTYVSDSEIKSIVQFWKDQGPVIYNEDITKKLSGASAGKEGDKEDIFFDDAVKLVISSSMASASMLQRRLKIGYNRASRIIEMMEERGIIGPHVGSKGREIYIESIEDYENMEE